MGYVITKRKCSTKQRIFQVNNKSFMHEYIEKYVVLLEIYVLIIKMRKLFKLYGKIDGRDRYPP